MTGYERRKQRKREQIIRSAIELFREHGIKKTTVQEIATFAGVSQVTIYNHFGDKRQLVAEALRTLIHEKIEEYRTIMSSDQPWRKRLETVVFEKHRLLHEFGGEFIETLYREMPEVVADLREMQKRAREEITHAFLDEGRRQGFVSDGISNEVAEMYFECIARGFDSQAEFVTRVSSSPELLDQLFDLIVYGLIRPPKRST